MRTEQELRDFRNIFNELFMKVETMRNLKITQCKGEGQGSYKMCEDNGKWNRNWMCFFYKIEGYDGCYCSDCVEKIKENYKK